MNDAVVPCFRSQCDWPSDGRFVADERRGSASASRTVTFQIQDTKDLQRLLFRFFPSGAVLWRRIQAGFNTTIIIVTGCVRVTYECNCRS